MSTHCLRLLCTLATLATALATDAVELSEHPCWLGCHRAIEIIATPIYYIGMAFYYLLYPVIYLVEWWRWFSTAATASGTAAAEATGSFLTWIIMFIPNLILSLVSFVLSFLFTIIGWILYYMYYVLSLLPSLIATGCNLMMLKLSDLFTAVVASAGDVVAIAVQTIGVLLVTVLCLKIINFFMKKTMSSAQKNLIYIGVVLSGIMFALEKSDVLVQIFGTDLEDELIFIVASVVAVVYLYFVFQYFGQICTIVFASIIAIAALYILAITGTLVVWVGGKIAEICYMLVCGTAALAVTYIIATHLSGTFAFVFSIFVAGAF